MTYGAILRKGEKYYTSMRRLFDAIGDDLVEYNWLITNCECITRNISAYDLLTGNEYCWLSGQELNALVEAEDFQWIWAVLSGFESTIPLEDVLKFPLPYADGYGGFWEESLSIQNDLASVEIVPWDSSLVLLISRRKDLVDRFRKAFSRSEDLCEYNRANHN